MRPTGLGEPDPGGKRALFRPPVTPSNNKETQNSTDNTGKNQSKTKAEEKPDRMVKINPPKRVRTTIDLSRDALRILQELQQRHRLETGRVLPLWKVVSEAIEYYGKMKGEIK